MKEFKYTITDPEGIHARPAGELVKVCKEFACKITLTKDGKTADCKKIFGLMGLAVKKGALWNNIKAKVYLAALQLDGFMFLVKDNSR